MARRCRSPRPAGRRVRSGSPNVARTVTGGSGVATVRGTDTAPVQHTADRTAAWRSCGSCSRHGDLFASTAAAECMRNP